MSAPDVELMRDRLLEASLAAPPSEELLQRILARTRPLEQGLRLVAPVPIEAPAGHRAAHFGMRRWLEAASLVAAIGLVGAVMFWRDADKAGNTPRPVQVLEPAPGEGEPSEIPEGFYWLKTGSPAVRACGSIIEMLGGRAMLKVGSLGEADKEIIVPWLDGHPLAANTEERSMLLDKTKWFIKGTLAICILAGAVSIDGEIVRAQGKADPREDEIDDYFLPTDANSDTKVSWEECLFRERTASAERDKAKTPEASKRWLVKYQWRLDREEFLHADQNDDLSLTRSEWRTWLDKDFGEEGPPALSRKDLLTLAIAAVDEQWGALMADADTDKDQKLSAPEIRNHFIRSYAAESDDKKSNAKSFTDADKDQDNRLDKSEYAQFSANEAHRGDEYYIGYLITHGFAASDKETGVVAKKLNAVEIGTVWFKKVADTRKEKKDMGAQDTAPPASYSYYRYKITAKSALGFKSIGLPCSSDLIVTNKSDKSVADYTWDKGCEPKSEIIEMVKVGDVELECYVYETGGSAEGAKPQPSEKKWVLTTCPIIVVKHIKDGQVIEETVKFGE